jgi:hypothetical protein
MKIFFLAMPCLTEIVNDLKKQVKRLNSGDRRFESSTPSRSSSCSSSPRPSSPDVELEMVSTSQFKYHFCS